MSHKEMCIDWVEEHKVEDDYGHWWIVDENGEFMEGPFLDEDAIDDVLWRRAIECAHERFIPSDTHNGEA